MTARAARDTAITGTRLEATCCANSGCLSPCVSLSGSSVTCVPYVSAQSQDSSHRRSAKQKSHRGDKPAMVRARLPTRIRLKSWARMVNDRLVLKRPSPSRARLLRLARKRSDTSLRRPGLRPLGGALRRPLGSIQATVFSAWGCFRYFWFRAATPLFGDQPVARPSPSASPPGVFADQPA
jgi:hypothetical protein